MKIYQIDSSARKDGSTSRALAKKVLEKIKKPEDEVIYRDLNSFPQVLHIILLGNLWVWDFMAPKHHEMWMNSRYDLWYLFRHI